MLPSRTSPSRLLRRSSPRSGPRRGVRRGVTVAALAVVVAVAAAVVWRASDDGYRLKVAMPSAVGVVKGTPVQIAGRSVGRVVGVAARDDQAIVTVSVDAAHAPLPAGSQASVEWRSLLGERYIAVTPGPKGNPAIPNDSLLPATTSQVTVEDLLETLDPQTREHLKGVISSLDQTLDGRQRDLNATIKSAGPTVAALGDVLNAVGTDGPAIRELVTKLRAVAQTLAGRQDELSGVVRNLGTVTSDVSARQQQLSNALGQLPPTLDAAKNTFDKVPPAVDALDPVLDDVRPAAARLPTTARNLAPLLRDLKPSVAQLRPTLAAADRLLGYTPDLLDSAHATVPDVTKAVEALAPAVAFLRPYTPELTGFIGQFGNIWSLYDSQGHFAHALITVEQGALDNSPPLALPGMTFDSRRTPGANAGQPWTDATGSGPR